MYEDHSIWAQWSGQAWPLNLAPDVIGYPDEKTNEHDHFPGDEANPVCVPDGGVCGTLETGPSAVCCPSFTCEASRTDSTFRCRSFRPNKFIHQ
jgi:hypothetical protein